MLFFFFIDPPPPEIYPLPQPDPLPLPHHAAEAAERDRLGVAVLVDVVAGHLARARPDRRVGVVAVLRTGRAVDRKSTRLNSSHANISYAVFCLKKKKTPKIGRTHV